MTTKKMVIGIGSPFGGDCFGWHVVRLLAQRLGIPEKGDRVWATLPLRGSAASEIITASATSPDEHGATELMLLVARQPTDVLDELEDVDHLVLCDACQGAGSAGTLLNWEWPNPQLPIFRSCDSHGVGLANVLALADQLGKLPRRVTIWAAECDNGSTSSDVLSEHEHPPDELARELAERLLGELQDA